MPESGTAAQPIIDAGTQAGTPVATMGYGAREQADETRQASQGVMNDVELDVNFNSVVVRSQATTLDVLGKAFVENHDARQKMADANSDWREIHKGRMFGAKPAA